MADEYVALTVKIAELVRRQQLWAMRHKFGELEQLELALDEERKKRAGVLPQMLSHCREQHPGSYQDC